MPTSSQVRKNNNCQVFCSTYKYYTVEMGMNWGKKLQ